MGASGSPLQPRGFVTLQQAKDWLATALPSNLSGLQQVIHEATSQIQAYLKRDILRQNYVETYDSRGFSSLILRQYPVNQVFRVAVNPQDVITIGNMDAVTNQRAMVRLNVSVGATCGPSVSGLVLQRVASGVTYTDTSISFSVYPTMTALAEAVNALGNGWDAQTVEPYPFWPTTDFLPNQPAQNCLANGPNGSKAALQAYVQDVSQYTLYGKTGELRFNNQTFDPVYTLMNIYATPALTVFPNGWQTIRVEYDAGYETVPYPIQQACLITIKEWMYQLNLDTRFDSETQDKWTYKLGEVARRGLPSTAINILNEGGWRSFRRY